MMRDDLPEDHSAGSEPGDGPASSAWGLADHAEMPGGPLVVVLLIAVLVLA